MDPLSTTPVTQTTQAFRNVWEFISVEEGLAPFSCLGWHLHHCATLGTLPLFLIFSTFPTPARSRQRRLSPPKPLPLLLTLHPPSLCHVRANAGGGHGPLRNRRSQLHLDGRPPLRLQVRAPPDHHHHPRRHWGRQEVVKSTLVSQSPSARTGGPQFRGEAFKTYCKDNGILHDTRSLYNPSNGLAEAAVKNIKKLLVKCIKKEADFQAALAKFRNCPRANCCSPAHIMFRCGACGRLPSLPMARNRPATDEDFVVEKRQQASYA